MLFVKLCNDSSPKPVEVSLQLCPCTVTAMWQLCWGGLCGSHPMQGPVVLCCVRVLGLCVGGCQLSDNKGKGVPASKTPQAQPLFATLPNIIMILAQFSKEIRPLWQHWLCGISPVCFSPTPQHFLTFPTVQIEFEGGQISQSFVWVLGKEKG